MRAMKVGFLAMTVALAGAAFAQERRQQLVIDPPKQLQPEVVAPRPGSIGEIHPIPTMDVLEDVPIDVELDGCLRRLEHPRFETREEAMFELIDGS